MPEYIYYLRPARITAMNVTTFLGQPEVVNGMAPTIHKGYLPPINGVGKGDQISDSTAACLFRNCCCLPICVVGNFLGCIVCLVATTDPSACSLCESVDWWTSHTIWCGDCPGKKKPSTWWQPNCFLSTSPMYRKKKMIAACRTKFTALYREYHLRCA